MGRRLRTAGLTILSGLGGVASEDRWWSRLREDIRLTWSHGQHDLHGLGFYWHLPSSYSPERRRTLNDAALGLGWGLGREDDRDNEHLLFVQASRSSHFKPQYTAGYLWNARWRLTKRLRGGLGYVAFVFCRSDVYRYLPLPGIVPVASLGTDCFAVYLAYLPGIRNGITGTGNVLYLFARVRL